MQFQIPVTYAVINNAAYAAVGAAIKRYAGTMTSKERDLAVDLAGPSLANVVSRFGARGIRAADLKTLAEALNTDAQHEGPVVIEIMTDPLDLDRDSGHWLTPKGRPRCVRHSSEKPT